MSLKRQGSFKAEIVPVKKKSRSASNVVLVPARRKSMSKRLRILPELKCVDYTFAGGSATANSAVIVNLSLLAQGTNNGTRVGNKIHSKSLRIKFNLFQGSGATLLSGRFIVVQDTGFNSAGTAPLWTDVMSTSTLAESDKNFLTTERFRIIRDSYYPNVGNANQTTMCFDEFIPLMDCVPTQYVGSAATQASCGAGAIYIMWLVDQTVTSTGGTSGLRAGYDISARLSYYDN